MEDLGEEGRERACKNFFNDPLLPTLGLMRCRKVKMSTCQLDGNALLLLFLVLVLPRFFSPSLSAESLEQATTETVKSRLFLKMRETVAAVEKHI